MPFVSHFALLHATGADRNKYCLISNESGHHNRVNDMDNEVILNFFDFVQLMKSGLHHTVCKSKPCDYDSEANTRNHHFRSLYR